MTTDKGGKQAAAKPSTARTPNEDVPLDSPVIRLSDAEWRDFVEMLDRPATFKPRLAELLRTKNVLE